MENSYQAKVEYTLNGGWSRPSSHPTGTVVGYYATGSFDDLGYVVPQEFATGRYVATYICETEYPSVVIGFITADTNFVDTSVEAKQIKTLSSFRS